MNGTAPTLTASAAASLAAPPAGVNVAAARKTAEDFESFFLSQTFESMFSDVGTDSLFGGGDGEKIYRSMLLQQYSKIAAKTGGVGIADAVEREMLRMQEAQ
jgi:peptidoglycan hydrolase FlgJ